MTARQKQPKGIAVVWAGVLGRYECDHKLDGVVILNIHLFFYVKKSGVHATKEHKGIFFFIIRLYFAVTLNTPKLLSYKRWLPFYQE